MAQVVWEELGQRYLDLLAGDRRGLCLHQEGKRRLRFHESNGIENDPELASKNQQDFRAYCLMIHSLKASL